MKWLNILGITFQFLSFWFAAPELLGPEALKRFEQGLTKLISSLPTLIITVGSIAFGAIMSVYGIKKGLEAGENGAQDFIQTMITIGVISVLIMVYVIFFAKRSQRWMERVMAKPLIHLLITKNETRKMALIIGAVLFTLGFVFQLIAGVFGG